ncbi:MAG: DNA/RNA non-specific endonuclease [Alphaproteobacteria bacterium]|nr:DNA/RNA non-specific endonuclease [Alphaproteobacteria bacterium]
MTQRDARQLRAYLELISPKDGGLDGQVNALEALARPELSGELEVLDVQAGKRELAREGIERLARNKEPTAEQLSSLEAIIDEDLRPAIDIIGGSFKVTHPLWTHLSDESKPFRGRIETVIPSIGRIELPGHPELPYGGTGFVVGKGLIMTNRHVAEIFATGLGDRGLRFIPGVAAGIDFLREQGSPVSNVLGVHSIVMIHPYWDMAILGVEGLTEDHRPLSLSLTDARDLAKHDIVIIGYPAFDGRNPSDVQKRLFDGRFGIKRLQPGELQGGMKTGSFGKLVPAATHDCSTLGGNSGSAVVDLSTGHVLALHFGGLYHQRNYAVPTSELARDSRVVDAGILFAGTPTRGQHGWADWWARADAEQAEPPTLPPSTQSNTARRPEPTVLKETGGGGAVNIEIPLRITISLGEASAPKLPTALVNAQAGDSLEALREPYRDTDYTSRRGYDQDFLEENDGSRASVRVPMPSAADPAVLAKTRDGSDLLHYQNFSIRMHKTRRLALVTACNLTRDPRLKKPEADYDYTRKGLSGLDEDDRERWFLDPRLAPEFQLPDVFFTKDRGSFDKGHLVRREDVAWGESYALLRRANGDTFHVTNCSPQVAAFNQAGKGVNNWGDLEDHVLREATNERLCLFSGPVLDPTDEVFVGVGDGGTVLRAKIPARYWKVIVARVEDGIAAYGRVG